MNNIRNTIELENYEILIVDSGGTATLEIATLPMVKVYNVSRQGAPQARNFGASKASSSVLLFIDAHLEFSEGWGQILLDQLRRNENSIITPTISVIGDENSRCSGFKWKNINMDVEWLPDERRKIHEVPFACGCCMAMTRSLFDDVGKFEDGIRFWGLEDSELCLKCWLFGYKVLCDPSIRVGHKFRSSFPYKIEWFDIIYNKIWFSLLHFSSSRLTKFLKAVCQEPDFNSALLMSIGNEVLDKRKYILDRQVNDDNWFFQKFPMSDWVDTIS